MQIVKECEAILRTGLEVIHESGSEDVGNVTEEVANSRRWALFCSGACLVYSVALRIKRSFVKAKLFDKELEQLLESVGKLWTELRNFVPEEVKRS